MSFKPQTKTELQTAVTAWTVGGDASTYNSVPIKDWDTSLITDMSNLFFGKSNFNDDISNWDVSNVTNMGNMFDNASTFNQPIEQWNVGNVTYMGEMFYNASAFNQDINGWNVGSVTDMGFMFMNASAFNQPIEQWNVGNVTNMRAMFNGASSFNQPLANWERTGSTLGKVTDLRFMFLNASAFNQPDIKYWNTTSVTNYLSMFSNANANMIDIFTTTPSAADFNVPLPAGSNTGSSGVEEELQAIDDNDTGANLSDAGNNKKRLAIALAKLT